MKRQKPYDRYIHDAWPVRLGNLSSTLARLSSRAKNPRYDEMIINLLREGALYIEWGAPEMPVEVVQELAPMQRELCLWQRVWPVEQARDVLALRAQIMADRVLTLSGLLQSQGNRV